MGDLLFFVYTSTPHRHIQNNFKNEKKTMGIFMSFSVSFSYLFVRFYTNNYSKGSRILRLPFIAYHCKILFSCILTVRLRASSLSSGTPMSIGARNLKPTMFFRSALNSSVRTACAVLMKSPLILGSHLETHHSGRFSRVSVSNWNSRLRLLSYMGAIPVMRIVSLSKRKPTFPKWRSMLRMSASKTNILRMRSSLPYCSANFRSAAGLLRLETGNADFFT